MILVTVLKKYFYLKFKRKIKKCFSYFDPCNTIISGHNKIEILKNVYLAPGGWIASLGGRFLIEEYASIERFSHIISTKNIHIDKGALIAEKFIYRTIFIASKY